MSLAVLADHMASKGRGPDSMLIHMSPREVQGLQALAENHGGSLTINPETGLPEAGFLDKLLPTIIGAGLTFFGGVPPNVAAAIVGGIQTVRTGDLGKGIQAGLGAYSGASLTSGLTTTGAEAIGGGAAADAYAGLGATAITDAEAIAQGFGSAEELMQTKAALAGQQATSAATPFETLSAGASKAANSPMQYLKANALPLAGAFGPAILAEMSAKSNMPQTVTKPGMITPYSYFGGQYVAGAPYQASPTRAAGGGLMGMDDGGYGPGQLDFTQRSEPVVRMAEGGVPGYAAGGYKPSDTDIFNYFKTPGLSDAQIATDMQKFGVSAADIARATGTQGQQTDYEKRFVNTLIAPGTDSSEFLKATGAVGLKDQSLATAMNNAGLSQGAQYALTHGAQSDAGFTGGIIDAKTGKPVSLYTDIGYTAGALPGDQGGLEGLYGNINYVSSGLQKLIDTGKMTVAQAQNAALAELARTNVSLGDVKAATGMDFGDLFTAKVVKPVTCGEGFKLSADGKSCVPDIKGVVTCGPGFKLSTDGKSCVPDTVVVAPETSCPTGYHWDKTANACVKNVDATQTTTTTVDKPTSIDVADKTALPVGVSGAGITTINPNGTITTRPNIPGIPEGGFTGMQSLRDAYEEGGGSLGYLSPTYTREQFKTKYEDKLTGGSKQAYDYLTGKTKYTPVPYTEDGQIAKSYAESVMKIPRASSSKMYIFKDGKFVPNPEYAIPTYDSKGVKSTNLTNADVKTFMDKGPSADAFYTWATTNNLSPEQIALASGKPINEISKLYTGAKELTDEEGKIDQTKVDAKAEADFKANFDYAAYLKANPDVQAELDAGKANFGSKDDLAAAAYEHYQRYGKAQKRPLKAAGGLLAGGGLAALTMARGGMAEQYDLGGYSDGGRLLRGPGDGVSDSIPATIGNKRPARLADGEFVVPARIVSELGNGSTEAGARKLYAMMDRVQSARRGTVGKGRVAKNSRSDKYLPA